MQKKYLNFFTSIFYCISSNTTRALVTLVIIISLVNTISGQSKGIGINSTGVSADPSSILDVKSSSKGLLIPRMTTVQMSAIHSPAQSLLIYNTTLSCFEIYIGAAWLEFSCVCTTIPNTPATIAQSMTTPPACTAGVTYTCSNILNAISYNWTVPSGATITAGQGTRTITVTWGNVSGYVTVTALNSCGSSGTKSQKIVLTNATHGTQTFTYTGTVQTWTAPACIANVTVTITGAGGGASYSDTIESSGGLGGQVTATLDVTAGEILSIYLGQKGTSSTSSCDGGVGGLGGYNNDEGGGCGYGDSTTTAWYIQSGWGGGGGGGAASSIRVGGTSIANRVIVAGGGGGAGADYYAQVFGSTYGTGGSGGKPAVDGSGYLSQEKGRAGGANNGGTSEYYNNGSCTPNAFASGAGGYGNGGNGGMSKIDCEYGSGGGGGGGYNGGSGGCGGGGGGGYSYCPGPGIASGIFTSGVNAGNGSATITW